MKGTHRRESRAKRGAKNSRNEALDQGVMEIAERRSVIDTSPLEGKTKNQERYLKAMKASSIVLATGPAGVGKTFMAAAFAAQELLAKRIDHILVTRPAVEAGESLGFLPGELDEKFDPYLQPFKDVFYRRIGKSHTEALIKSGKIEATPLGYLRGRTFRNSVVILDEAQNTTPKQMKMFLTRIGENCTVIVNGDIKQMDIDGPSGLADAVHRITKIPGVTLIQFDKSDIVRSGIVQAIVEAYEG